MASKPRKPDPETKTSAQALKFVRDLQQKFERPPRTKAEAAILREHLGQFDAAELRSVARRVLIDLMRGPDGSDTAPRAPGAPPKGGGGRSDRKGGKDGDAKAPPRAGRKRAATPKAAAKAGTRRATGKP